MVSLPLKHYMMVSVKGYTLSYGRAYYEWIDEKVRRIRRYLSEIKLKDIPIDVQFFAEYVYGEKLLGVRSPINRPHSKIDWMPVGNVFTDFKPSPFIKNFINYIVKQLVEKGYVDRYTMKVISVPDHATLFYMCRLDKLGIETEHFNKVHVSDKVEASANYVVEVTDTIKISEKTKVQ